MNIKETACQRIQEMPLDTLGKLLAYANSGEENALIIAIVAAYKIGYQRRQEAQETR